MDPLFKWPGGKSRELSTIRPLVPGHKRFIEPFAGGAAVFFDLEPSSAILNDINPTLILAYQLIGQQPKKLEKELRHIASSRKHIALFAEEVSQEVLVIHRKNSANFSAQAVEKIMAAKKPKFVKLEESKWAKIDDLYSAMTKSLISKIGRIINHEKKGAWSDKDVVKQIETAFHAGLYTYIRDKQVAKTDLEKVARFLYLREFCYGAMFRYNKEGKFNIPYGGYSYNSKSFSKKINNWFDPQTVSLLKRTGIYCLSFEDLTKKVAFKKDDFIFLDPPYDTEFSDYDQFSFDAKKQKELAEWYAKLPCPSLMIIGKTPLIEKLYKAAQRTNPGIVIEEYEKTYAYNVKGRNERKITHLAIRNYPLS